MKKLFMSLIVLISFSLLPGMVVAVEAVVDIPNTIQSTLNRIEKEISNRTQFQQLRQQIQQITQMKTRLSNLTLNIGLNTWDPRIPDNYDYRGSASAEYKKYQKEGRSFYGKPWSAGDFTTREGDQVMAFHYKRLDDHSDHTDSKIKHILRKKLPKADKLLKSIHEKYRYLTQNCKGKTVDDDSKCSAANRAAARVDMQLVMLKYRKEMSQMMALMVQMQMLQQRGIVEIQKQVLRPGIKKSTNTTGSLRSLR